MADNANPEVSNTFAFSNYTPQREGARSTTTAFAISKMLTEGLYNLDQLFLTPIRIVTWLAAAGIGAALIGPWGWFVLAPGLVLMTFSLLRALYASPKAKDVVSVLTEAKSPLSNLELDIATEDSTRRLTLIKGDVIKENNQQFFISLYEENGRLYTTKIAMNSDEIVAHKALASEYGELTPADVKKYKTFYASILRKRIVPKTEASLTVLGWFFKAWTDFAERRKEDEWKKLSFGEALLERIEFLKKNIVEPLFFFLFDAAFLYWIVWSGAYLAGAINTAVFVALPFGTPLMLLGPLLAAVVLMVAKNYLSYRRRNEPTNKADAKNTVEMLVKMTRAKQVAALKSTLSTTDAAKAGPAITTTVGEDSRTTFYKSVEERTIVQLLDADEDFTAKDSEGKRKWGEDRERRFYQKFKDFFLGNFSLQAVTDVNPAGYRTRILTHALLRLTTGLILGFIAFWPVFDLVTTQWLGASGVIANVSAIGGVLSLGAAGSMLGPAMLGYFALAAVIGLSFMIYSFTKVPKEERFHNQEADRYKKLSAFRKTDLYKNLRNLERLIALKKTKIAIKREEIDKAYFQELRRKDFGAYLASYFTIPLGIIAHFIALVRGKANTNKVNDIDDCILAHDDKEFMEKFNLWKKSKILQAWDKCKLFFNRFNEVVTAGGSGMLLVRILFFAASACSVVFGTSIFSATPLIAGLTLGIGGAVWATLRLCVYLYKRDQNFADMLNQQTPAYETTLKVAYGAACEQLARLEKSDLSRFTSIASCPKALPPVAVMTVDSPPPPPPATPVRDTAHGRDPDSAGTPGPTGASGYTPHVVANPHSMFGRDGAHTSATPDGVFGEGAVVAAAPIGPL